MKGRKQCLIIDDDVDDQEIFLMCINKISKNIDCMSAFNGAEAVLMLRSDEKYVPDYIFLDVNMPKMNGIECLAHIKSIKRLNNTKVFMYSTTSESSTVLKSKELGADDFIVKPSKTLELKEKLSVIFDICSEIDAQN
jgi:PleD family two-component response regulator